MIVGDLISRYYAAVGDDPDSPVHGFARSTALNYLNRGCLVFRSMVEDRWVRVDVPVVASQAIYSFPSSMIRAIRLALHDSWLQPASILELAGLDPRWEADVTTQPTRWSSDGLDHDKYRLWPKPTIGSAQTFTTSASTLEAVADRATDNTGMLEQYIDVTNATWGTDPANPSAVNPEYGLVVLLYGFVTDTEFGEIFNMTDSGIGLQTIWGVENPPVVASDNDEVPVRDVYGLIILWYMLWQTYSEEGEHGNSYLSKFYMDKFNEELAEARMRAENPLPRLLHRRRAFRGISGREVDGSLEFSGVVIDPGGNTIVVRFPKSPPTQELG